MICWICHELLDDPKTNSDLVGGCDGARMTETGQSGNSSSRHSKIMLPYLPYQIKLPSSSQPGPNPDNW